MTDISRREYLEQQLSRLESLLVVRHSQTAWNEVGKLNSRTDLDLSDEGRKMAEELSVRYQGLAPNDALIFSSPLKRAIQTSELIFNNRIITKDDRLVELDFGVFEGRSPEEVRTQADAKIFDSWRNTGMSSREDQTETLYSAIDRAISFFSRSDILGKNIVVISHGVFLRLLISAIFGEAPERYRAFILDNCHYAHVRREGGILRLVRMNCLP